MRKKLGSSDFKIVISFTLTVLDSATSPVVSGAGGVVATPTGSITITRKNNSTSQSISFPYNQGTYYMWGTPGAYNYMNVKINSVTYTEL